MQSFVKNSFISGSIRIRQDPIATTADVDSTAPAILIKP